MYHFELALTYEALDRHEDYVRALQATLASTGRSRHDESYRSRAAALPEEEQRR